MAGGVPYNVDANTNSNLYAANTGNLTIGGLASNTQYIIRLFNNDNSCYTDIPIQTPPITCTGFCEIQAVLSALTYNDNGTPAILTDDTLPFKLRLIMALRQVAGQARVIQGFMEKQ